ncbi:MAG: cell envelope integrity protein TolA [Thiothrix sp.]
MLPIQIDAVLLPVGFTMRQTGNLINWDGDAKYPEFIRLLGKVRELVEQHDAAIAEQAGETEVAAAEQERLAQEKAEAERQAREQAEKQRRLEEEARQRREVAEAAERERLAKEKAAAEQKAREAADRQRWLEESQARLVSEEAAKQKKLSRNGGGTKSREERAEAERQAKAKQDKSNGMKRLPREQACKEIIARQARGYNQTHPSISLDPGPSSVRHSLGVGAIICMTRWFCCRRADFAISSPAPNNAAVGEESLARRAYICRCCPDVARKWFLDGGTFS